MKLESAIRRGVDRPRAPQVRVGDQARHARRQVGKQDDRQGHEIHFARRKRETLLKHAVLGEQESVRPHGGLRPAHAAACEGQESRRVGLAVLERVP